MEAKILVEYLEQFIEGAYQKNVFRRQDIGSVNAIVEEMKAKILNEESLQIENSEMKKRLDDLDRVIEDSQDEISCTYEIPRMEEFKKKNTKINFQLE